MQEMPSTTIPMWRATIAWEGGHADGIALIVRR
jgi:hypothetical protein